MKHLSLFKNIALACCTMATLAAVSSCSGTAPIDAANTLRSGGTATVYSYDDAESPTARNVYPAGPLPARTERALYGWLRNSTVKEPDTFCAGAGLSPCCHLDSLDFNGILMSIFGEIKTPESEDLACLADKMRSAPNKPRLYMAMGTDDFLYENAQPLRKKLEKDYDFTYYETKATHSWDFWDSQIQTVLKWMFDEPR